MREYVIEHGDVWLREKDAGARARSPLGPEPVTHVCDGTGMLAVAFDAQDGTLHKTGDEASVSAWATATAKRFADQGFDELAEALTVVSFGVSPETVAELNLCRETSGRVLKLTERLGRLVAERPELLDRPVYPPAVPRFGARRQ